jgi:hypothetical protein
MVTLPEGGDVHSLEGRINGAAISGDASVLTNVRRDVFMILILP